MIGYDCQQRIEQLQKKRRKLIDGRKKTDAPVVAIDMELNVIRAELQAIYGMRRNYAAQNDQEYKVSQA